LEILLNVFFEVLHIMTAGLYIDLLEEGLYQGALSILLFGNAQVLL
jgi:hypothetical protein